jgi:hypothetical protein
MHRVLRVHALRCWNGATFSEPGWGFLARWRTLES